MGDMRVRLTHMASLCSVAYIKEAAIREGLYKQEGFLPVAWFDRDGTQAALLTRDNTYYLVFRGTDEPRDWLSNLTLAKSRTKFGRVHKGFNGSVAAIWKDLLRVVQQDNGIKHFVVCGHSKGAAEATIAACRLHAIPGLHVDGVYLFGSPRTLGRASRYSVPSTFRVVNNNDIVCRIPSPFRFRHVGKLWYLTKAGRLVRKPNYLRIAWDRLRGRVPNLADGIHDHPIVEYLRQLRKEV